MKAKHLGEYKSVNAFVRHKLDAFRDSDRTMGALFGFMYSEGENIMIERTDGYTIERRTYAQCKQQAIDLSERLHALLADAQPNAIVGLCMDNSAEWIALFWAILRCGFRPLLMNTRLDDATLDEILITYGVVCVLSDGRRFAAQTVLLSELEAVAGAPFEPAFANEVLLMTSGTSEHVKLCAYTGEQFFHQIESSAEIIRVSKRMQEHYEGELKHLTFLPFYHIFGLTAVYIWFAFFSRTFVLLKDYSPKTLLNTVRKHKVTHIFAIPLLWERIYETAIAEIEKRGEKTAKKFQKGMAIMDRIGDVPVLGDLFAKLAFREVREGIFGESPRFMISGGSRISPDALRFFNRIGYRLANGYGMSEIGIASVELSNRRSLLGDGAVGRPIAGYECRIEANGELAVKGESAASAICLDGKRTDLGGDWFLTHDMARIEDGRLFILGRADDLIVCENGENLNPDQVEARIRLSNRRPICLLTANGEPTLVIELSEYANAAAAQAIREEARAALKTLRLDGAVRRIVLTKTPLMGAQEFKVSRARVRRALESGEIAPYTFEAGSEQREDAALVRRVTVHFAEALRRDPASIEPNAHFFYDLGGTSLDYFAMVAAIQGEYNVGFPTDAGQSLSTVNEICRFIREQG